MTCVCILYIVVCCVYDVCMHGPMFVWFVCVAVCVNSVKSQHCAFIGVRLCTFVYVLCLICVWCVHDVCMMVVWFVNDLCMCLYDLCMICLGFVYDCCMFVVLFVHDLCMVVYVCCMSVYDVCTVCLCFVWCVYDLYIICASFLYDCCMIVRMTCVRLHHLGLQFLGLAPSYGTRHAG